VKRYAAAFPTIDAPFIDELRARHDPLAHVVAPHVTLLFPTSKPTLEELIAEVELAVRGCAPFSAVLRSALAMPDGGRSHVFLVPDEGFAEIVRLHERLYAGVLASELRLDVPFVPHMTVAAGLEHHAARALARQLNERRFAVPLVIDAVDAVEIVGDDRRRGRRVTLGP